MNTITLLTNETADFLFMVNLHYELDSPKKTLKECNRLLKPVGIIAISDWRKDPMEQDPSLEIRVKPEEFKVQLEKAGFSEWDIYRLAK